MMDGQRHSILSAAATAASLRPKPPKPRPPCGSSLRPKLQRGMLSRDSVAATTLLKHAGQERMPPLLTASLFFLLHTCPQGWLSY